MTRSDGWSDWGEPRKPRPRLEVGDGDRASYCPRCDDITVWKARGDGVNECECGVTVTTILQPHELDRLERHYRVVIP